MNKHERKIRKLKVGNIITNRYENDHIKINSIKFDDIENDFRAFDGQKRVTINGLFWDINSISIISRS